jgi:hypothetical protein
MCGSPWYGSEGGCQSNAAEVARLRTEVAELRAIFDLGWSRTQEATRLWQAEAPEERALVWPDLGHLIEWMIQRHDKIDAALAHDRAQRDDELERLRTLVAATSDPDVPVADVQAADTGEKSVTQEPPKVRPWEELRSTGLLWLINRVVFHPRGWALSFVRSSGEIAGWRLLGDGREVWRFNDGEDGSFAAVQATLAPTSWPAPASTKDGAE